MRHLTLGVSAVFAVTTLYVVWLHVENPATVSTTLLMVVLVLAATSRLWVAMAASLVFQVVPHNGD